MGGFWDDIFGSEETRLETQVSTVVSRAIADTVLPNAVNLGASTAILKSTDMVNEIMEQAIASIGLKVERMYAYGESTYVHGLPSGRFVTAIDGKIEATQVLTALEGNKVTIEYHYFRQLNFLHVGWSRLIELHGYVQSTNEIVGLTTSVGFPVYLDDIVVVIPSSLAPTIVPRALEQWSTAGTAGWTPLRQYTSAIGYLRSPTPIMLDSVIEVPHILIKYIWEHPSTKIITTGSFTIALTGFNIKADYFHVKYTVNGVIKYWLYQGGLGTYPLLDSVFEKPYEVNGTFYPFAYFRYNKASEVTDKTTNTYLTTKKLLKYLGMDLATMGANIDANPNIGNVEQAMLHLSVPASSVNPIELRYLYMFFNTMYGSGNNKHSSQTVIDLFTRMAGNLDYSSNSTVIQDKRFKMVLSNAGITKRRTVLNTGPIGTYSMVIEPDIVEQSFSEAGIFSILEMPVNVHCYRHQITNTLCDEVRVRQLQMMYHIYGGYNVIAADANPILLIPLDRSITSNYSVLDREQLYARSLHYIFNSHRVIEVKYYTEGIFGDIMMIVAIVITIYTMGASSFLVSLAAAAAAGIGALAIFIIQNIAIQILIQFAVKLFVQAVGPEAAFAVAAIAAAYGVYSYSTAPTATMYSLPVASTLLTISSSLVKESFIALQEELALEFLDVSKEFTSWSLTTDAKEKELVAANKLLENNNYLRPMDFIVGQTPTEYFSIALAGNIGTLGISALSSFVDIALTLPKINDTLGENTYG